MKRLFSFVRLNSRDRQLFFNTFILLGLVRLGLWLLNFQKLLQLLAKFNRIARSDQEQIELKKIVWAVNLSSRYMFGDVKCLARALTTQSLMIRHGYSSQLQIGVAKEKNGQLEAHAWIESQGRVVIGYVGDLSRYAILPSPEAKLSPVKIDKT
jgi:hypothetical protein